MKMKEKIKNYLKFLEDADYEKITELFSEDAVIYSPLSGRVEASEFYKDLFKKTERSEISKTFSSTTRNGSSDTWWYVPDPGCSGGMY